MRNRVVYYVGSLLLLCAPAASAGTVVVTLDSEHAEGHVMTVPRDSGRDDMEVYASLRAEGFVCTKDTVLAVQVLATYPDEWAGASTNPDVIHVRVPANEPGVQAKDYDGSDAARLEMKWGAPPATGAETVYTLKTTTRFPTDSTCAPAPAIEEDEMEVKARMDDMTPNATRIPECAQAPELPECGGLAINEEGGAESPGFEPLALLAGIAGVAWARRRR